MPWCAVIWYNGSIVPFESACIHVTSETALRGVNVFEGLRAYWQPTRARYCIPGLDLHFERLTNSAAIARLPAGPLVDDLKIGCWQLLSALNSDSDVYLRPTIYLDEGAYTARSEDLTVGAFIAARFLERSTGVPTVSCAISSWRREQLGTVTMLAKTGATYNNIRLARLEAQDRGADEAIFLNEQGLVTETGGACVFVVKDGLITTPRLQDGVLDGVTRRISMALMEQSLGLRTDERGVHRDELYTADEAFICGTLDEIRCVASVDGRHLRARPGDVTRQLYAFYTNVCRGVVAGPSQYF